MLSNQWYNRLKLAAQFVLPLLAASYFGLAEIWGLPAGAKVSGTISIINVLLGGLLGFAKALYEASGAKYDGHMVIEPGEDNTDRLRMRSVDISALQTKDELMFRVTRDAPVGDLAE